MAKTLESSGLEPLLNACKGPQGSPERSPSLHLARRYACRAGVSLFLLPIIRLCLRIVKPFIWPGHKRRIALRNGASMDIEGEYTT